MNHKNSAIVSILNYTYFNDGDVSPLNFADEVMASGQIYATVNRSTNAEISFILNFVYVYLGIVLIAIMSGMMIFGKSMFDHQCKIIAIHVVSGLVEWKAKLACYLHYLFMCLVSIMLLMLGGLFRSYYRIFYMQFYGAYLVILLVLVTLALRRSKLLKNVRVE